MARRRKSDDAGAALLLGLLALAAAALFVGLAYLAPVALLFWWLYREAKWTRYPSVCPPAAIQEQAEIQRLNDQMKASLDSRAQIVSIAERDRIPRRSDDYFDGRFANGREINRQLESIDDQLSYLHSQVQAVQDRVQSRASAWTNARAKAVAGRSAIATYLICLTASQYLFRDFAVALGKLTDIANLHLTIKQASWIGASVMASLSAGLVLWIKLAASD